MDIDTAHPLVVFLERYFPTACEDSARWLSRLPRDMTPAEAFAKANDEWQRWARKARRWLASDRRAELDALLPNLVGPPKKPVEGRPLRALLARMAGRRLMVDGKRCVWCDGEGCRKCDFAGSIREEAAHPADAWTAHAFHKIGTTYGAGSPP